MNASHRLLALVSLCALAACEAPPTAPSADAAFAIQPSSQMIGDAFAASDLSLLAEGTDLQSFVDAANTALAAQGAGIAIHHAEWMDGTGDVDEQKIVFANNRTLRLTSRWVSGDTRRGATGPNLTQGSFPFFQVANGAIPTEGIIDATFDTWNAVKCSKLQVDKTGIPVGVFPSAILSLTGFANDPFAADISTVGWLPAFIFDAVLGAGASNSVLGVTFTFVFTDGAGNTTDVDNDGRDDTAIKEVWYNDAFTWTDAGAGLFDPEIDIETVALHENGHALELGHFGKLTAHVQKKGVRIQASPRAVMNATYIGSLRAPRGTDGAAMCGNYASW